MTRVIRESDRFTFFIELFTQYTAVLENKTGAMSNWNTGSEALDEMRMLISIEDNDFDSYCEQIEKS